MRFGEDWNALWRDFDSVFKDFGQSLTVLRDRTDEDPEKFSVEVDVPGYDPASIKVEVVDRHLKISAKDKRRGDLARSYALPESVDASAVEAACSNGVLIVSLPKAKKPVGRVIEVKVTK